MLSDSPSQAPREEGNKSMNGPNHHDCEFTAEEYPPNKNLHEDLKTDDRLSDLLKAFGESLVTKENLAQLFERHPASIQRAVERDELPPPIMLLGKHYWTVDVLTEHFKKRFVAAAREKEQTAEKVKYLKTRPR